MTGRPCLYTPGLGAIICDKLAEGQSLRGICGTGAMPSFSTVKRWLRDNDEFRAQYARAREDQADHLAEEALETALNGTNDDFQKNRLKLDAIKWFAGKVSPKKYGDRQTVEMKHEAGATFVSILRAMQGKGDAVA